MTTLFLEKNPTSANRCAVGDLYFYCVLPMEKNKNIMLEWRFQQILMLAKSIKISFSENIIITCQSTELNVNICVFGTTVVIKEFNP